MSQYSCNMYASLMQPCFVLVAAMGTIAVIRHSHHSSHRVAVLALSIHVFLFIRWYRFCYRTMQP